MIMPILHHIRKKKMDLKRLVFPLLVLFFQLFSFLEVNAASEEIKTINLSIPTNYGTFFGEIHYSDKDKAIALKIERIVKEDLVKVINYFEYVPHDTVHFNVDPYLRLTNGNARIFPTNIINIYNFPASNLDHLIAMENWMQGLVVHEFVHITHLDQTRDYLNIGRKIFGTIAKVPNSLVPRWFTEGIAVWGESHFTSGGRLNNQLFNKELLIHFKKNDYCKTIDCLDDPGAYPSGSLAYWAGGQFMEYLENLRPHTIKCLVEENSSAVPFLLNNAFEKCTGQSAQSQFIKFRNNYSSNEAPLSVLKEEWGNKINNSFGDDFFQKGLVLDEDSLFKVERKKKSEALVAYDLTDGISYLKKYEYPIVDVSSMVLFKNKKRLLVSFNEDPNFRSENKTWKLIHPDTLLVEQTLKFAHDPSYVIPLGGENYITFSYFENRWIVEKNNNLLHTFSTDLNITMVQKIKDQLLLKINDSYGETSLIMTDLEFQKLNIIYKSANLYELPLITDNYLMMREGAKLKLLEWDKIVEISDLPFDLLNNVTFTKINENRVLVLEKQLKTYTMTALEAESFVKKYKSNTTQITTLPLKTPAEPTTSYALEKAESYPRLDHMIPYYWFLTSANSDKLANLGALTSFVDPMEIHSLNASALLYPEVSKLGGSLDYTHKVVKVSDLWKVRAFFNLEYYKADFSNKINTSRDVTFNSSYSFLKKRWTYIPSLFASHSLTKDFISDRTIRSLGFSQVFSYKAMSNDDFFHSFHFGLSLGANKANVGNNFLITQVTSEAEVHFSENLSSSLNGAYGKFFKSDFSRGVIYGGGSSDYSTHRVYPFYGLPYSSAFGNELFSARLTIDYNFLSIYRGKNLIPFFLKEAHFIFGGESLYADRIILANVVLREKLINSIFLGPRLKTNLFYYVPANIDLIFSSIAHPNGGNVKSVNFLLAADFF